VLARLVVLALAGLGLAWAASARQEPAATPTAPGPESVTVRGVARFLPEVLRERKVEADAGPVETQVVVVGDEGVTPLVSNAASRALWLDERLRGRPVEVLGWRHPGLPYLEVTNVRVEEQGAMRAPEYYCDVCTITVRYPQVCPCCQGDMELRFDPMP
jgi:hypothetical protein